MTYNPNQKQLFGRAWSLALGTQDQNFDNATHVYTGLRVKFEIDKNLFGSANKAKFEIWNLSELSRQAIKKGYAVRWQAGYQGLLGTLFIGAVLPDGIKVVKDPDGSTITKLECGDGEQAIVLATYDQSYPAGTTLVKILNDLANNMDIGIGNVIGIPAVTYNNGVTLTGTISDSLNKLCKSNGLKWYVHNGNLNITPINGYNGSTAIVVSSATGMIGKASSGGSFTRFTNLLNPQIAPDSIVQLKAQTVNGFFRVNRALYEGDTHDESGKWQVDCECVSFPNVGQVLPAAQGSNFLTAVV